MKQHNPLMAGTPFQRRTGFTMQHALQAPEEHQQGFFSRMLGGNNNSAGAQPGSGQRANAEAAAQQAAQQQPGQPAQQGQESSNEEENPLDIFSGLFDNTGTGEEDLPPEFTLSPDTLTQVADGMDFMRGVSQEDMQAAQNGDMAAMMKMMQHVGRQAYTNALQHNAQLTDKFVSARSDYDRKGVAPAIREHLTGQEMEKSFSKEAMANPAVKSQLVDTAKRLAKRHPDASPAWVADQAKQYLMQVTAQALGLDVKSLQNPQNTRQQQPVAEVDWEKELGL
jgi:hypothetical protein